MHHLLELCIAQGEIVFEFQLKIAIIYARSGRARGPNGAREKIGEGDCSCTVF